MANLAIKDQAQVTKYVKTDGVGSDIDPYIAHHIVDSITLPADPLGANADDVVAAGAVGSLSAKLRRVTQGLEDLKSLIVLAAGTNAIGTVAVSPVTTGGWSTSTPLVSAASNNATVAKASAGRLGGWIITNNNAAIRYVKFYDKATTPNPASDTPVLVVGIPGNTAGATGQFEIVNGIAFLTGISFAAVTGSSNTDNTSVGAGDLIITILYK